jgi:hypothetical protein
MTTAAPHARAVAHCDLKMVAIAFVASCHPAPGTVQFPDRAGLPAMSQS